MARYTVGNKYKFVHVKFTRPENFQVWSSLYHPGHDILDSIVVLELECISEHDVPDSWSGEVKHKGYRFKDTDGNLWVNQYPTASYGQLDDSADWKVSISDEGLTDAQVKQVVSSGQYLEYTDLSKFIGAALRAVRYGSYIPESMPDMKRYVRTLLRINGTTLEEYLDMQPYWNLRKADTIAKMGEE